MSKTTPPRKHKTVTLSLEVVRVLEKKRIGFESHDAVLRRLLQLPPRKRAA
jgi:predicted CopG family antitoxin